MEDVFDHAALETVCAIPVTPFAEDGALDEGALAAIVGRMLAAGIDLLVPGGNTGEYYTLTDDEWRRAVRLVTELARPSGALVVPGVGRDLETAGRQAAFAADLGCPAVMVHQPLDPFVSGDGWLRYHERLAERADGVSLVGYVRDPRAAIGDVVRLLDLARVAGVKYALPDPVAVLELVARSGGTRAVVCGLAEMWAPPFSAMGAVGFTSGLANVAPALSLAVHERLVAGDGDGARALVEKIAPFEALRAKEHGAYNVAVVKAALARLGLCTVAVRPPASGLSAADARALELAAARLGDVSDTTARIGG